MSKCLISFINQEFLWRDTRAPGRIGGERNKMKLISWRILPKLEKWYFPVAEDDMAEGETRGDRLPVSCSPPVEWERSHSLPSSWLACRDDGVYLQNSTTETLKHIHKGKAIPGQGNNWRSLLFRLNNILTQIESNYNCLMLPDYLTPSVWLSQEKENKGFWKENYASVRYAVETYKQWGDIQVNWKGLKSTVFGMLWRGGICMLNMVDSGRPAAKGIGVVVPERHRKWNTNWHLFSFLKKEGKTFIWLKCLTACLDFLKKEEGGKNGLALLENKFLEQNFEME